MRIVTASCRIMIVSSVVLVAALLALFFGGGLLMLVPVALGVVGPGFVMRKAPGTVVYHNAEAQIELIARAMLTADSAVLSELHQSCDRFHWTDQRPQTARWFIVKVTGMGLPSTVQFIRISGNLGIGYCQGYHGTYLPVNLLDEATKQKLAHVLTQWYGHIR